MTLWDTAPRSYIIIKGFHSSLPETYRVRLMDLGFREGAKILCVRHAPFAGPRVFQVDDAVFALEKTIAEQVVVEVIPI